MRISEGGQRWGAAVLRFVLGVVFLLHGWQKLFVLGPAGVAGFMGQAGLPAPWLSAVVVSTVELLGGAALVAGIFTRWAAALLAITMLVATVAVHLRQGFFLPNGFEYTLTLLAANVALLLSGPGAAALDSVLARRRSNPTAEGFTPDFKKAS